MFNNTKTLEESLPKQMLRTMLAARERALAGGNVLVAGGLFAAVLLLGIPYFGVPHFWDSLQIVAGADHILNSGLNPLLPTAWDPVGHPVLLHELLAVTWLVAGQ